MTGPWPQQQSRRAFLGRAGGGLFYHVVEDRVTVHDLHATMLHLLGIDHARLSVKFQGLDWRLTGVEESRVVREILT